MRRKPEGRFAAVAEAALAAFTQTGYRLTQLSDVARLCGLSAGALYGYVESKEALLHLAVAQALDAVDRAAPLPYRLGGPGATLALLKTAARRRAGWPRLKAALAQAKADDVNAELRGIAAELFALLHRERRIIWLLEACLCDLPAVAAFYNRSVRGRYYRDFERYLRRRIEARQLAPLDEPGVASRAVIELVAWLGMHRLRAPAPAREAPAAQEAARRTAEILVWRALSPLDGAAGKRRAAS